MDTIIGIQGKNFSMVAYERTYNNQIFRLNDQTDKHFIIDDHTVLVIGGKKCDADVFGSFIQKNIQFLLYKNGYVPSLHEKAFFIRTKLAEALRKGPYEINCILIGYDKNDGPGCYYLDYTGVCSKVKYGAQGYSQYFLLGLLNDELNDNITEQEGVELIKKCIYALKKRFMVQHENWTIQIVNNEGVKFIN